MKNKTLKTVKVQVPTYDDEINVKYINFGTVFATTEDIKKYFLSIDKQQLFNDYKEYKENLNTNKVKLDLNEISCDEYVEKEFEYIREYKPKYKFNITDLMKIYFNEPLQNSYEYNLSRGISQNFIENSVVWHSMDGTKRVETKYLVYEENKFELIEDYIIIDDISFVEL